jgi:hypothetical protein
MSGRSPIAIVCRFIFLEVGPSGDLPPLGVTQSVPLPYGLSPHRANVCGVVGRGAPTAPKL